MLQNRYNWRPSEVFCKMTPNPIIKLSGVFIWVLRFPSLHSYKPFVFSFPEEFETCHYDFKILFTPNEKCPGILKKIQQQRGPKANISIFNSNVNFKSGIAAKWLTVPTSQLSYVCINFICRFGQYQALGLVVVEWKRICNVHTKERDYPKMEIKSMAHCDKAVLSLD